MSEQTTKPKILIVTTHPVQYQVPWFRHLHSHIDEYEFEILYFTIPDAEKQGVGFGQSFQWDIPMFEGYKWTQVKTEHLRGDLALDNFLSIRLKNTQQLINNLKPSAVLLTGWQCLGLIQVLLCCRKLNIPCLIRAESNNLKPRAGYKNLIHQFLLKHYDKYLSIGIANRNFYLSNNVKKDDIFDCPYFVDNAFFKTKSKLNNNQLLSNTQEMGIPVNAFCFCYVGKLNSKKRILDVLTALKRLNDQDIYLLVVGDGELMQQAKAYSDKNNLNVRFAGFLNQSEIPHAYALSDCLILASDYDETWGLVVNEAMASGIPAIVSHRSGCHLDLIKQGSTGYCFEFGNINELANTMQKIKSLDKKSYTNLCQQAQENVIENYSIDVASHGLKNALKAIF